MEMGDVFNQVLILFIFVIIGFVLAKTKILDLKHSKMLSTLIVYVFLPCKIFGSFSKNFTVEYITSKYQMLIISIVVLIVLFVFGCFIAKLLTKDKYEQKIYVYSLMFANFGYFGYTLAESLFGSTGLLNLVIISIPSTFILNSVGYCVLTKTKFSPKLFLKPILISIVLGTMFGLAGIKVPNIVSQIVDKSSACMGPVSMLLCGIVIAEFDILSLFKNYKVYIVVFLRLIVIPFAVGFCLKPFVDAEILTAAVLLCCMPCGLNTIVFPKLVDENCSIGASLACISTILSCVTIPLCLTVIL